MEAIFFEASSIENSTVIFDSGSSSSLIFILTFSVFIKYVIDPTTIIESASVQHTERFFLQLPLE